MMHRGFDIDLILDIRNNQDWVNFYWIYGNLITCSIKPSNLDQGRHWIDNYDVVCSMLIGSTEELTEDVWEVRWTEDTVTAVICSGGEEECFSLPKHTFFLIYVELLNIYNAFSSFIESQDVSKLDLILAKKIPVSLCLTAGVKQGRDINTEWLMKSNFRYDDGSATTDLRISPDKESCISNIERISEERDIPLTRRDSISRGEDPVLQLWWNKNAGDLYHGRVIHI